MAHLKGSDPAEGYSTAIWMNEWDSTIGNGPQDPCVPKQAFL